MANTTRPERAGADLGLQKPTTEAASDGRRAPDHDRGVQPYQGENTEEARQAPVGAGDAPEPRRQSVEEDALSEFAQSSEGHEKNVAPSGSPRVTVGTSETRFEQESGD